MFEFVLKKITILNSFKNLLSHHFVKKYISYNIWLCSKFTLEILAYIKHKYQVGMCPSLQRRSLFVFHPEPFTVRDS